jgi:hypothetical protein
MRASDIFDAKICWGLDRRRTVKFPRYVLDGGRAGAAWRDCDAGDIYSTTRRRSAGAARRARGRRFAILSSGAQPGLRIVAAGGHYLHEGERVQIVGEKAAMR